MSINRSNNRRRGRGSNRGPGSGGQGNRIDSRARGNAPQLLEKYRKLAHDASLNDDRVQTEYFLQFADHYFRVLADSRSQKDDQRPRHQHERDDYDEDSSGEDDGRADQSRDGSDRSDSGRGPSRGSRDERSAAQRQPRRNTRGNAGADGSWSGEDGPNERQDDEGEDTKGGDGDNPFVRDDRARPARGGPPRRKNGPVSDEGASDGGGLDPGSLPPSIGQREHDDQAAKGSDGSENGETDGAAGEPARAPRAAAKPRATRARVSKRPPADDGDQEALEAIS